MIFTFLKLYCMKSKMFRPSGIVLGNSNISLIWLGAFKRLWKVIVSFFMSACVCCVCVSVCLSIQMEHHSSCWTDFHENSHFEYFLKICHSNLSITITLQEDVCTFMIISRPFLLGMRIVTDRSCRNKTFYVQ